MISSIVVGTDGSDTARKAVQEAADLAAQVGATMEIVSAYAPVSNQRLREEARPDAQAPDGDPSRVSRTAQDDGQQRQPAREGAETQRHHGRAPYAP